MIAGLDLQFMLSAVLNVERRRVTLKESETTSWLELVRKLVLMEQTSILPEIGHFSRLEAPFPGQSCDRKICS